MKRVLVVDDEALVRGLIAEILGAADYDVVVAESAEDGLRLLEGEDDVAAVVSDIVMPGQSGLEFVDDVHARRPSLPVVLATGAGTIGNLADALARGAQGFVAKPFTHAELREAVATALLRAERSEQDLRERLLAPTLASALANAIEARQAELSGHCERLAALARRLARELGLDEHEVVLISLGATLHDVGKIGIPDSVLLHDGPLELQDRELMRTHTLIGDRLLEPLDLLVGVRPIVRHHHERWDGCGYPDGLRGREIPLAARIVSVADAVEAMSARRIYRDSLPHSWIVAELREGRGRQWDPRVVDVALRLIERGELRFDDEGLRLVGGEGPKEREAA